MSYQALVTRITTRPIPGADNIVLGNCNGYQVIVSKDTQDGELGVFFEQGGQLSEEFCRVHDLIRRKDPETGLAAGGYFEENRRVKAVKMRGVKSEGFWVPVGHFGYCWNAGPSARQEFLTHYLQEGTQFTELNGHPICCRYETPATRRAAQNAQRGKQFRGETPYFRKQPDIEQFRHLKNMIPDDAVIYITEKLHGTSHRVGYVLDNKPQTRWQRFLSWGLGRKISTREYTFLDGSKNVILDSEGKRAETHARNPYYPSDNFRLRATRDLPLHKGETVYGELVGWHSPDGLIMGAQETKGLPEVAKAYGPKMVYSYGQEPGTCGFYVYRITMTNEDGVVTELSWPQVERRAKELGVPTVPLLQAQVGKSYLDLFMELAVNGDSGQDAKPSTLDSSHIREGVVVRWESPSGTGWLKHKSWVFGVLEGYLKGDDTYVDTEEIS